MCGIDRIPTKTISGFVPGAGDKPLKRKNLEVMQMKKIRREIEQSDKDREEHLAFDAWIDAHDRATDGRP